MDKHSYDMFKYLSRTTLIKVVLIVVLIIFLAAVYHVNDADDVPMKTIEKALEKSSPIAELKKRNTRELMEYIGVDYAGFEEVLYYKSNEALNVSELMIIKAYEKSDLDDAEDAVERRLDNQVDTYVDYGPKQVAMLGDAVVLRRGKYLFYCVAKDPEKYEEVFLNAI